MVMLISSDTTLVLWYQIFVSSTTGTNQLLLFILSIAINWRKLTGIAWFDDDFHRLALVKAFRRRFQDPEFPSADLGLPAGQSDVIDVHVSAQSCGAHKDPVGSRGFGPFRQEVRTAVMLAEHVGRFRIAIAPAEIKRTRFPFRTH